VKVWPVGGWMEEQAGQSEGVGAAWCICRRSLEMAVIAGVVEG